MRTFLKKRQQDQLTVAVTILFLHYGKTTKQRNHIFSQICCQALFILFGVLFSNECC